MGTHTKKKKGLRRRFLHQKVHAHSSSSRTKYCTQNKEQSRRRIGSRITSSQIDEANGLVGTDAIVGGVSRRFQFEQKKRTKKKQKKKTKKKKKTNVDGEENETEESEEANEEEEEDKSEEE